MGFGETIYMAVVLVSDVVIFGGFLIGALISLALVSSAIAN
jgi:hypothetical protein